MIDARDFPEYKTMESMNGVKEFEFVLPYDFQYDGFPREFNLFFEAEYEETRPHVSVMIRTPDGREFKTDDFSIQRTSIRRLGQLTELRRQAGGLAPPDRNFLEIPIMKIMFLKGRI